jgi:hypothetical protein
VPYLNFIDTLFYMKLHLLFLAVALSFAPVRAFSTSFNIKPFSEFTQGASNIVRGTVSNVHVENGITSDGGKTIYTYANLAVKETLKGNIHSANITVRKLGGTKDGMTLEIPSSPEFVENDDTVLYLGAEQDDRTYEVVGLELGKFGLENKNGDTILTGGLFAYSQPPADHDHPGESEHAKAFGDIRENQRPWSLSQLRELIKKQGAAPTASVATASSTPVGSSPTPSMSATPKAEISTAETSTEKTEQTSAPSFYYWIGGLLILVVAFSVLKRK